MDAVLSDWETAPVSDRLRAGLRLVEAMTLHPTDITHAFVDDLKSQGLDIESIEEAGALGFQFNFINRIADAFDFDTPSQKSLGRQTKFLNLAGKFVHSSSTPIPSWNAGADGLLRPVELNLARDHFLSVDASTEPSMRCAVEAYSARARGGNRPEVSIPKALVEYVKCLSLHASRLTDESFDVLRDAAYSDEAIYEVTMAGALGASFAGIEFLFEALHGQNQEPEKGL